MRQTLSLPGLWTKVLDLRPWIKDVVGTHDVPRAKLTITAGVENGSSERAVTVRVVDRRGENVAGDRWWLRVFVGTAATGLPGGTQTVVVATGTQIQAVTAGQVIDLLTDDDGKAVLTVTVTGAGTRYVSAVVVGGGGELVVSTPFAWV